MIAQLLHCVKREISLLFLTIVSNQGILHVLAKHLEEADRNAMYTSKTIQNEIIECIGEHIREGITSEVKKAKFYFLLCDEITDVSVKEQMSFVSHHVMSHVQLTACNHAIFM